MPRETGVPTGTLVMLILRVLHAGGPLHGYAIAQRIHLLSDSELKVEEGSLYPALQKMLAEAWVKADWAVSETGRKVREYKLTKAGEKQLNKELSEYERMASAVRAVIEGVAKA